MIGQTISHYKVLEKSRHKDGGQVGEGGMSQNRLPTSFVSPALRDDFEDPRLPHRNHEGGQAPSFWRRCIL